MTIYGELYTFNIEPYRFDITPKVPTLSSVSMEAIGNEDFSIFELGPVIVDNITFQATGCTIGDHNYGKVCVNVIQHNGKYIIVTFRHPRANETDPVDSGEVITAIKDYVIRFE